MVDVHTLVGKIPEDTWSAVLKTPPEEKWLEGAWFRTFLLENATYCPLAAGDLTHLYPPFWFPWSPEQEGVLQSFGLQAGHPHPTSRLLMVAPCLQVLEIPQLIHPSIIRSQSPIGYSLPFPFSPPALQSPHCFRSLLNVLYEQCRRQKCNDHPVWARWYTF